MKLPLVFVLISPSLLSFKMKNQHYSELERHANAHRGYSLKYCFRGVYKCFGLTFLFSTGLRSTGDLSILIYKHSVSLWIFHKFMPVKFLLFLL